MKQIKSDICCCVSSKIRDGIMAGAMAGVRTEVRMGVFDEVMEWVGCVLVGGVCGEVMAGAKKYLEERV